MRRICSIAVMGTLLAASVAFAGPKSAFDVASTAKLGADNMSSEVVVPITIAYDANLSALDIPLKFSEGVTLKEVRFGEMVSGFDFKTANIKNEDNLVVIGAIHMVYGGKADLSAGDGVLAELVFSVDDPTLSSIRIEKTVLSDPDHDLWFVYNQYDENNVPHVVMTSPDFAPVEVALSGGAAGGALPKVFDLKQNYPNPFNPSTKIQYDVPTASRVKLEVYNVLGQRVTTLVDDRRDAGAYEVEWDSRDAGGSTVSSGVYFYKFSADDGRFVQTRKMMLLK